MTETASSLPPIHPQSRVFDAEYRIRVDDVDPTMTVRLDGIARFLQDIAIDMMEQSDYGQTSPFWIVRRTIVDVVEPITWPGDVTVRRWCSAASTRWVNMRQQVIGRPDTNAFNPDTRSPGLVETESFSIHVTRDGRPARIDDAVLDNWSAGVTELRLRWRSMNVTEIPDSAEETVYPLRPSDFDMFEHMNNATYWFAVEQYLRQWPEVVDGPFRAVIEYLKPVPVTDRLIIRSARTADGFALWFLHDDTLTTTVTVAPLPTA